MDNLNELIADIQRFEAIISEWDENQRCVAVGLQRAIESLHKAALTNLIKTLKQENISALRHAVDDEIVYAVLLYHNLVKPPLSERIQTALAEIRPSLQSHDGDVELVAIKPPDRVEIKLIGSCSNCASSTLTLTQLVEQTIKKYCPELTNIVAVNHSSNSPLIPNSTNSYWMGVANVNDIPENHVLSVRLENHNVILYRQGDKINCYRNACSHLGFPLDKGTVENDIITCASHQFQYDLKTGECLTVPGVSLQSYEVRVKGDKVYVKVEK
ncbi:NifU family protein [Anabaena azotica]|uniref:NifU family protein n=1 Tax=Anabaena azotica TaxID=197653 RepID=UPI0039A760AF